VNHFRTAQAVEKTASFQGGILRRPQRAKEASIQTEPSIVCQVSVTLLSVAIAFPSARHLNLMVGTGIAHA
jgi:hypothetical protein